jgi:hypothetical protein
MDIEGENSFNARRAAADAMCLLVEDVQIIDGIPEYRPIGNVDDTNVKMWMNNLLQDGPLPDEP